MNAAGGFVDCRDLAMTLNGLTSGERLAVLHDVATDLVKEAVALGLPLVIEWLNFSLKKRRLKDVGCDAASRRLSSFAYSKFAPVLKFHARLHGVAVVEVQSCVHFYYRSGRSCCSAWFDCSWCRRDGCRAEGYGR